MVRAPFAERGTFLRLTVSNKLHSFISFLHPIPQASQSTMEIPKSFLKPMLARHRVVEGTSTYKGLNTDQYTLCTNSPDLTEDAKKEVAELEKRVKLTFALLEESAPGSEITDTPVIFKSNHPDNVTTISVIYSGSTDEDHPEYESSHEVKRSSYKNEIVCIANPLKFGKNRGGCQYTMRSSPLKWRGDGWGMTITGSFYIIPTFAQVDNGQAPPLLPNGGRFSGSSHSY